MKDTNETNGTRVRGRYVGPTAARIAELIAPRQRVRFERGWFWTAAACHGSEQDLLAFRQRPDGDGIDVRCPRVGARGTNSAGCSRERIIRRLETLGGESIWSAYRAEDVPAPPNPATESTPASNDTGGRSWRVVLLPFLLLLLAAPVALGYDLQVVALNAFGLGWTGWLAHRIVLGRLASVARAGRRR
ncbi:MAG: hypothetical protein OXD50_11350 [Chloroflexi bacterium]|nr:hypothetical protein [Chloroflexota bacterium]